MSATVPGAAIAEVKLRRDAGLSRYANVVYPVATLLAVAVLWQLAVMVLDIDPFILPSPIEVVEELVDHPSIYLPNIAPTVIGVLLAFALSAVVGVTLGVVIATSKTAERCVYPLLVISQAVPKVAVAPLFVVWLGFGMLPKLLLATLIAFFPAVLSTVSGLQGAPREFAYLGRSMGASNVLIFRKILFPSAMPSIFTGLKLAMTFSVIGQVIGEFVGSNDGLGYLVLTASSQLNTPQLFAALLILAVLGIVAFYAVVLVERLVYPFTDDRTLEVSP